MMARALRWVFLVGLLAIAGYGWWQHRAAVNPEALRTWIAQFGAAGPLIYVALYAANTVTLLPPIGILSLTAGLAFGPAVGFAAIMTGATIGTSATFFISHRLGRGFVEHRLKGRFKSLDEALGSKGFATVLFFRIVPIVPYEALNYASGLSRIRFRNYALATFLGLIPGAAVAAWFGNSLTRPFSKEFLLALVALVILIAIPTITLKVRRKKDGTD
ncbi:MAG: TVP38/TMEM64 family protein [Candidatus Omnitrophica bacterium]|nr:TVP38/TMEM64 family protein [Candidatus Omnitrophota bacterium]